ncbi:GlsB/YeaQ/YmgE family stress response membrane protein [Paracoccus sp. (in: a-proteobacteria)]|uniref:GlsB/YeaQ/YmgE family stress response membrane protein n=1 Tax=Paracoccus sp. TaxID=267 RepID=UPI0026DFF60F|nr:GlsB/YeaQ/YmgE family stress response membrane protein [Paracoccus sp. (in: a-proteobacteria)]MDO5370017.1 GlsB/YeaQ/YmgE family stress response membrane protein [Paracoccus sp. (in: a-proteobacteria)]
MGFIVAIIIGAIAGWLAGKIVKGHGQGALMNIVVGVLGAVLASWLFPTLGWNLGAGPATGATVRGTSFFGSIVFSTIGAVILLVIVSLFTGRR